MSLSTDNNEKYMYAGGVLGADIGALAASRYGRTFMQAEKKEALSITNAAHKVLRKTKLKQKGVSIWNITDAEQFKRKFRPDFLNPLVSFAEGKSAGYNPSLNVVAVNMKKIPLTVFHEIGHAYNNSNNIFSKCCNKIKIDRFCMPISIAFALLPLFINKTPEWKKESRTFAEKIKDGIYNNAPILAAAAYTPTIIEEGLASYNASKLAKPLLKPTLYNKMTKGNLLGFSTYILGLISFAALAKFAQKANE